MPDRVQPSTSQPPDSKLRAHIPGACEATPITCTSYPFPAQHPVPAQYRRRLNLRQWPVRFRTSCEIQDNRICSATRLTPGHPHLLVMHISREKAADSPDVLFFLMQRHIYSRESGYPASEAASHSEPSQLEQNCRCEFTLLYDNRLHLHARNTFVKMCVCVHTYKHTYIPTCIHT